MTDPSTSSSPLDFFVFRSLEQEQIPLDGSDAHGFRRAYCHLHVLSQDENGGLLENNLLCESHQILMSHRKGECTIGCYSDKPRVVEFEGDIHHYALDVEEKMQRLIDDFNPRFFHIKWNVRRTHPHQALQDLLHLLTWLVSEFLSIHPFGDGNGRMVRLLFAYILQAYGFPFPVPISLVTSSEPYNLNSLKTYHSWCKILNQAQQSQDLSLVHRILTSSLTSSCQLHHYPISGIVSC